MSSTYLTPGSVLATGLLCGCLAMVACSNDNTTIGYLPDDDGGTTPVPDAGIPDVLLKGDTSECTKCSDDRRTVLDCQGAEVATCAVDQECAKGTCVSACEAAKTYQSNVGCDFFAVEPDLGRGSPGLIGDCFAAYVVNTWDSPVTITVDRDGTTFDTSDFAFVPSGNGQSIAYDPLPGGQLQPGQVAVLFLGANPTAANKCPAGPAMATDPAVHGTGFGAAFHIQTSVPVAAYDIYPYGGGNSAVTSATLLFPTSAWGTNYIGVDAYAGDADSMTPWMAIVAAEDGTDVTLSPTNDIVGDQGVPGTKKGVPHTYSLSRGQVLQLASSFLNHTHPMAELNGTPIQSTKPIAVWGGSQCMDVPLGSAFCDGAHQQIPPVTALGHEYAAVRPRDRYEGITESPPWRFVGAVDGTVLAYSPAAPPGAPTMLDSGQMVELRASDPFVVKSQDADHPFYVAGYMTGCIDYAPADADDCRGDPEFVNVVPPQQFLSAYTFFTDPTYSETHLVVVREKQDGAFADVTLDCAGALGGWQSVGDYEWTGIDLVRGDFEPQSGCDNGRHQIASAKPFGITVWGWGSGATGGAEGSPGFFTQAVSYAYPGGLSIKTITNVVVPPVPK